jgi:hypothetical protein
MWRGTSEAHSWITPEKRARATDKEPAMPTSLMLMQQLVQDRTSAYEAKAEKARRWRLQRRATAAPALRIARLPHPPVSARTTGTERERLAA